MSGAVRGGESTTAGAGAADDSEWSSILLERALAPTAIESVALAAGGVTPEAVWCCSAFADSGRRSEFEAVNVPVILF